MSQITDEVIQQIAGDLEKLLLESREKIAWAYQKIPDGFKVTVGLHMEETEKGISLDYTVSFPLESPREPITKETVKWRRFLNPDQTNIFEKG